MIVNNQNLDDDLIPEKGIIITNIQSLLYDEFNIKDFDRIYLFGEKEIIKETNAVIKLCEEDKHLEESYWIGTKNNGGIPGYIDPEKIVVIGNLDIDVPICIDFRSFEVNPPVIWLANGGWEKICNSHEEFMNTIIRAKNDGEIIQ